MQPGWRQLRQLAMPKLRSAETGAALARFDELRLAAERETCLSVWVPAVPWPRV